MKISNKRKLELRDKFKEAQQTLMSEDWIASGGDDYDEICIDVPEWDKIFNFFMDILDQELSNHTQRMREDIRIFKLTSVATFLRNRGCDDHDTMNMEEVQECCEDIVMELQDIPSLQTNPTKDNENTTN